MDQRQQQHRRRSLPVDPVESAFLQKLGIPHVHVSFASTEQERPTLENKVRSKVDSLPDLELDESLRSRSSGNGRSPLLIRTHSDLPSSLLGSPPNQPAEIRPLLGQPCKSPSNLTPPQTLSLSEAESHCDMVAEADEALSMSTLHSLRRRLKKEPSGRGLFRNRSTRTLLVPDDDSTDDENLVRAHPRRGLFKQYIAPKQTVINSEKDGSLLDRRNPWHTEDRRSLFRQSLSLSPSKEPSRRNLLKQSRSCRALILPEPDSSDAQPTQVLKEQLSFGGLTSLSEDVHSTEIPSSKTDPRHGSLVKQKSWTAEPLPDKRQFFKANRLFMSQRVLVFAEVEPQHYVSGNKKQAIARSSSMPVDEAPRGSSRRGETKQPMVVISAATSGLDSEKCKLTATTTSNDFPSTANRAACALCNGLLAFGVLSLVHFKTLATKAVHNPSAKKTWTTSLDILLYVVGWALSLISEALTTAISLGEKSMHWLTSQTFFQQIVIFLVEQTTRRKVELARNCNRNESNQTNSSTSSVSPPKKVSLWQKMRLKRIKQ